MGTLVSLKALAPLVFLALLLAACAAQPAAQPQLSITPMPVKAVLEATPVLAPPAPTLPPAPTVAPTQPPTAKAVAPVTANAQWTPQYQTFDGVEMALVPPGCFTMGTKDPPSGRENEKPTTKICFDKPFWIDRTEVTQGQFTRLGGTTADIRTFPGDNRPVERISWFESRDFCTKRGARLPTEAEWEYAARGPDNLIFPWGNTYDSARVVDSSNSGVQTADVGSRPSGASWVGALDMSGNVSEWTSSLYRPYPYKADDGRESQSDTENKRVVRGGSYVKFDTFIQAAVRDYVPPVRSILSSNGFRCARSF
ncbi:MAG: SUMF1/EgtB/PvdO family nonheme iron enzyme [Anaerolineae bacterium]